MPVVSSGDLYSYHPFSGVVFSPLAGRRKGSPTLLLGQSSPRMGSEAAPRPPRDRATDVIARRVSGARSPRPASVSARRAPGKRRPRKPPGSCQQPALDGAAPYCTRLSPRAECLPPTSHCSRHTGCVSRGREAGQPESFGIICVPGAAREAPGAPRRRSRSCRGVMDSPPPPAGRELAVR